MSKLTFENGNFILDNNTVDIKTAAQFRYLGDDKTQKLLTRIFNRTLVIPLLPPLSFLDGHQIRGVKWALSRGRSYLAHAPGAGKTSTAIVSSILSKGHGQTLFIVPPGLTKNWEREILKFTEPFGMWPTIGKIGGSKHKDKVAWRADFIICPDSMLTKSWVYTRLADMKIKFIAVDEASRFKEPHVLRSKYFYGHTDGRWSGIFRKARHVVFLDGSPMPNRPMELWAPTYALDPEAIDFMTQQEFGMKYCGAQVNDYGKWEFKHSSNEELLKKKLQKRFMHVVKESELNHPERRRSMLFMDQDVRSVEHKTWERKHLSKIETLEDNDQGEIAHFRHELGVRKIPWVAQYIRSRLENKNESILLFAWHREVCEGLAKRLRDFNPSLVIGGVKNETREAIFKKFQSGKTKLIIGNISAMGRGHNLQRADRVVFAEFSWTDELNKQCEKRASRRGRDVSALVRCEYIASPNSMDEKVLASLFTKEKRVRRIIG